MIGVGAKPDCSDFYKMLEAHSGDDGLVGKVARSMTEAPEGMYVVSPGTFTNVKPPAVRLAEIRAGRCFDVESYSVGDRGLHSVTEQPRDDISLPRYLGYSDAAARSVTEAATPADRDLRLVDYLLLPRLIWMAHERRRNLARFDGSRFSASMMFQSCFLAVETNERMSAKSMAPSNDRKPPEIF